MKKGKTISETLSIIDNFEKIAASGTAAVEDSEFDAVSGATKSSLGITDAIKDALQLSKNAAKKVIKKSIRITNPKTSSESFWVGDSVDLSGYTVEVEYSDSSKKEIKYSDFEKNGLKLVIMFDNKEIKISEDRLILENPNRAYDIFVEDTENQTVKDVHHIVAKSKYFTEFDLSYKISGEEFKKAEAKENISPANIVQNDYYIDITEDDIGKTLELKTDVFIDISDNKNKITDEYYYTPIKIEDGKTSIFIKGRGDYSIEDNAYLNPVGFDSRGIRLIIRIKEDALTQKEKLQAKIEKYKYAESADLKESVKKAQDALNNNKNLESKIDELTKEIEKVGLEREKLEELYNNVADDPDFEIPEEFEFIFDDEDSEGTEESEAEGEISEKNELEEKLEKIQQDIDNVDSDIDELDNKRAEFHKKVIKDDELKKLRLNIIKSIPMEESELNKLIEDKKNAKEVLLNKINEFKKKYSEISNKFDNLLDKKLYDEKVEKVELILSKDSKEVILSEYTSLINEVKKASDYLSEKIKKNDEKLAPMPEKEKDEKPAPMPERPRYNNIGVSPNLQIVNHTTENLNKQNVENNNSIVNNTTRISGPDRYATSVEMSKKLYDRSDTVILVNGEASPDALASVPLSSILKSPILLVKKNEIPNNVMDEIKRLGAKKIIIVGGVDSISKTMESNLLKGFDIERVSGKDRYETSVKIAEKFYSKKYLRKAIIVNGINLVDAISIPSLNNEDISPILLVNNVDSQEKAEKLIKNKNITDVFVIGGNKKLFDVKDSNVKVRHLSGDDRYQTLLMLAAEKSKINEVIITSGIKYIDALTVGTYAINNNTVVLVTKGDKLDSDIKMFVEKSKVKKAVIVGGEQTISSNLEKELNELINQ